MGGNPLTKEVAQKALKKLKAQDITPKGAAHPLYGVFYKDELIVSTGLRHSSNRDILVPHVKGDLRVSTQFVLGLAQCPKSRDDYLKEIEVIPKEEQKEEGEPKSSE